MVQFLGSVRHRGAGGLRTTLLYSLVRHDTIIILGQVLSNVIYVRDLMLIAKNRKAGKANCD